MMAPYTCNNFYDPVGNQSSQQPSRYTYQSNSASSHAHYPSQNTTYQTNYGSNYGTSYGTQQYASSSAQQQQPQSQSQQQAASTNAAASALQDYSHPAATSGRNSNVASGHDHSSWNTQNYASSSFNAMTSRSQANQSAVHATQGSSATFGRLSLPDQSQTSSNMFANLQSSYQAPVSASTSTSSGSRTYRNAPDSAGYKNTYQPQQAQQQQPPQQYASPLHAMQAQHHQSSHNKQPSRSLNQAGPSPQMSSRTLEQQRQQSASVESSPATVDPSQVYDFRAEQEKRARIEAEKRRKIEAERAAKQAEEDSRKAEEDARKAEEERIAADARTAEEDARKTREADAKKEVAKQRRAEQRRKAREEKRQSNTAATALQQMASSSAAPAMSGADMMSAIMGNTSGAPTNNEEAEMRAMFKKMREFNQKNPTMLAKLWEEERQRHAAQSSQQPHQSVQAAVAPPVEAAAVAPGPVDAFTKQQHKEKKRPALPEATEPPAQPSMQPSAASSGRAPAQVSPTKPPGGSLWPPHKKVSLAEAAAKWLGALPENTGRSISMEGILGILDNNPSYVQLCEAIEKTGIEFARSAFAKELLKAVPEGLKTPAGSKASAPIANVTAQLNGAAAAPTTASAPPQGRGRSKKDEPGRYSLPDSSNRGSGTVSYATPSFSSLADAAREVNSMNDAPYYHPAMSDSLSSALAAGNQQKNFTDYDAPVVIDDSASTPEIKSENKLESPRPREPADKEEAARKRGFEDLVDLTAADSDDEDGPPPKIFKAMPPPLTNGVFGANDFRKSMPYNRFMHQRQSLSQGQSSMHSSAPPRPAFNAKQFDQWPPPKPQSLVPITPGQVKPKGSTEEQKQQERMSGKMLVEPIMRDRVARKSRYDSRTIARDVLLATGRHPDMRALNGHMNVMQRLLGDHGGVVDGAGNKSDLKTIRWDIIDPGEPTDEAKARAKSVLRDKTDGIEESDMESSPPASRGCEETEFDTDTPTYKSVQVMKKAKAKRGPGRTPGEHVASDSTSNNHEHTELRSDLPHRASPGRPRGYTVSDTTVRESASSDMAPVGAVGYSAFRQYDESGNPIKKKGRPLGWRKSIHSREAQGLTPAKPKTSGALHIPKGPGASRLRPSGTEDGLVQPRYQVFRCKWRDCGGELDNLERLRKHVIKIHGFPNSDGDYECLWKQCRSNGLHIDGRGKARSGTPGAKSFENIEHWTKHINKSHVEEVAWELGDGPKGGSVLEQHTDSEAYLSDAHGRSVTPIILPQSEQQIAVEEGKGSPSAATSIGTPVKRGPGRPARHQVGLALGATSLTKELREAQVELKKLDDQKQIEGFTMGLQGSRLVNEKRRRGFLDDEDFEDVIHDAEPVYVSVA